MLNDPNVNFKSKQTTKVYRFTFVGQFSSWLTQKDSSPDLHHPRISRNLRPVWLSACQLSCTARWGNSEMECVSVSSAPQLENPRGSSTAFHCHVWFSKQIRCNTQPDSDILKWLPWSADLPAQLKHGDVGLRLRILERGAKKTAPKYWIILDLQIFWDSRKFITGSQRDFLTSSECRADVESRTPRESGSNLATCQILVVGCGAPKKKHIIEEATGPRGNFTSHPGCHTDGSAVTAHIPLFRLTSGDVGIKRSFPKMVLPPQIIG